MLRHFFSGGENMIYKLLDRIKAFDCVEAIAIAGSRASGNADEKSDYDVYVYYTSAPVPEQERSALYNEFCRYSETGNKYFEYEDNIILNDNIPADIIFRSLDKLCAFLARTVEEYRAANGYTTCFWHNLVTSKIYYDRDGRLKAAQERFDVPYPEKLRENIIRRNADLLSGKMPSYDKQIIKAGSRGDIVSLNHRTAAFLESYFDIIFALNRLTHPGEKKLTEICKRECKLLPADFEKNLNSLFEHLFSDIEKTKNDLAVIVKEMNILLSENGFGTEN